MKPQQLAVVIAILAALSLVAAKVKPPKFGLDINGGARVVLEAETDQLPKGQAWNADAKSAVLRTIERRVNSNGVSEPVITQKGSDQFVVEIPSIRNSEEVLQELQNTAQLQFFYSPNWRSKHDPNGRYSIERDPTADPKTELYEITDRTNRQVFHDKHYLNGTLRGLIADGERPGAAATAVPVLSPLGELPAAAGKTTLLLTADGAAKLVDLARDLTSFDAFLADAQLEMDGNDLQQPTPAKSGFDSAGVSRAVVELEFNSVNRQICNLHERPYRRNSDGLSRRADSDRPEHRSADSGRSRPDFRLPDPRHGKSLADYINSGALPVPLKIIQQQTLSPTLGADAVRQGLVAGMIGLGLIVLFMIVYYQLPGAVACVALALYTLFTYAIFVLIPVTFTLPGIAGFILSVGMAVDANILIFERTKEELRAGRTLRSAIEHGFQRAFSAISTPMSVPLSPRRCFTTSAPDPFVASR